MLERMQVKHDIILSLIKTAGFASLAASAKGNIRETADMLVDYIFNDAPREKVDTPPPHKSKRDKRKLPLI